MKSTKQHNERWEDFEKRVLEQTKTSVRTSEEKEVHHMKPLIWFKKKTQAGVTGIKVLEVG